MPHIHGPHGRAASVRSEHVVTVLLLTDSLLLRYLRPQTQHFYILN